MSLKTGYTYIRMNACTPHGAGILVRYYYASCGPVAMGNGCDDSPHKPNLRSTTVYI